MATQFIQCLEYFDLPEFPPEWGQIRRGIEKESLRITAEGGLAQTPHPYALGSALTHPYLTTDYSEALLELITPVSTGIDDCLDCLTSLHNFTYRNLPEGEVLWGSSMPCLMEGDARIPLAQYGSSNIGRLKTLYREGLGHRYGRLMQTIAGIHYNFSMPDSFWPAYYRLRRGNGAVATPDELRVFQTDQYLHLIRNFHRYSWLLLYLFGASPAVCRCFVKGRSHDLEPFDDCSLYKPYATCLRMGNLGYKSEAQESLFICYNTLDNYVDYLHQAMNSPYEPYEKIGQGRNGEHLQINTNLLQLENEFYSSIRPKRVAHHGERPLALLKNQGIEYIEVRALDLNPFLPLGIDAEQIRFLDSFLLFCLLSDSPECTKEEHFEAEDNLAQVVNRGREPQLQLHRNGVAVSLQDWARELTDGAAYAAGLLDGIHETNTYSQSITAQEAKIEDPELTPSARILQEMRAHGESFSEFAMRHSLEHQNVLKNTPLSEQWLERLIQVSHDSHSEQQEVEAADKLSFDDFLREWNSYKAQ